MFEFKAQSKHWSLENNTGHTVYTLDVMTLFFFFGMKKDTVPCIWPASVLLFEDISDGRDKAHMSRQPVSLSFSTKLTSGKRLGWAGLQLLPLGCLFGVTIL